MESYKELLATVKEIGQSLIKVQANIAVIQSDIINLYINKEDL